MLPPMSSNAAPTAPATAPCAVATTATATTPATATSSALSTKPAAPAASRHAFVVSRNRFHRLYADLCRRRKRHPLQDLRERTKSVLDFQCDRVRLDDWPLILSALAADHYLTALAVRSHKAYANVLETVDSEKKCRALLSQACFCAQFIFAPLIDCICTRLAGVVAAPPSPRANTLRSVQLEGLPLQLRYVQSLAHALQHNTSVRFLSVARSCIGDEGCELLCTTIKHLPHVDRVDFSGCGLTARGAAALAALLRYQKILRFSESWRQSLRYREVVADQIPGLKYVAMNRNAAVGDGGLGDLLSVLVEDEWIRGIEMQQCGITERGAAEIVKCLQLNRAILVFDVRGNAGVQAQTMNQMRRLMGIEVEKDAAGADGAVCGAGGSAAAAAATAGGAAKSASSAKVRLMQSKERIHTLEQQLAIEVEQRRNAEALNEQLHQRIVEKRLQLSSHHKPDAANYLTLVSKDHLQSMLKEVCDQKNPDVDESSQSQQTMPQSSSITATLTNSNSTRSYKPSKAPATMMMTTKPTKKVRILRTAERRPKSESRGRLKVWERSNSACTLRETERRMISYVERHIGDTLAGTGELPQTADHSGAGDHQPEQQQQRAKEKPPKRARGGGRRSATGGQQRVAPPVAAPSSYFADSASDGETTDQTAVVDGDPFAHGDC